MQLREWREKLGLTQESCAKKFKVSHVTFSRYENGTRITQRSRIINKIFELTNGWVTPNDIFGITEEMILKARQTKNQ